MRAGPCVPGWMLKPVVEIRNTRRKLVWTEFEWEVPWGYLGGIISTIYKVYFYYFTYTML